MLIAGGMLLWRRKALGFVAGTGLLFQTSMLFVGLIAILILQPMLTGVDFSLIDVLVVTIMGMVQGNRILNREHLSKIVGT